MYLLGVRIGLRAIENSNIKGNKPKQLWLNSQNIVTKKLGLKPRPFRTALILFNFID
jgi:hypothetical protein